MEKTGRNTVPQVFINGTHIGGFDDFVDRIYPIELEIEYTKNTDRSASYLDLQFEIDRGG
jgi:hypothetical protein